MSLTKTSNGARRNCHHHIPLPKSGQSERVRTVTRPSMHLIAVSERWTQPAKSGTLSYGSK
jgi:hypothetical protein